MCVYGYICENVKMYVNVREMRVLQIRSCSAGQESKKKYKGKRDRHEKGLIHNIPSFALPMGPTLAWAVTTFLKQGRIFFIYIIKTELATGTRYDILPQSQRLTNLVISGRLLRAQLQKHSLSEQK